MLLAESAMPLQFDRSELMLLAGMVMLGWVLIRASVGRRKRLIREGREADRSAKSLRNPTVHAVPLSDAPAQTQRWQAAMFDLQRELKGELDSRIAMVHSLVQHADRRIAELHKLQDALDRQCHDLRLTSMPDSEQPTAPIAPGNDDENHLSLCTPSQRSQIDELLKRGLSVAEIAERTNLGIAAVELVLAARPA